ncbi:MAG: hypothetical protein K5787_16660 [Lentisphaeria bacterium]|nr:hypothetical protein [Lentisphaeria bacterium]
MRHFLLIILFIAACHAADFGDVSIERLPMLVDDNIGNGQYDTHTYRLKNNGAKPVAITIREISQFRGNSYYRMRSIELAPMTTAHLTLYSPTMMTDGRYGSNSGVCQIAINGKNMKLPPELEDLTIHIGYSHNFFSILSSSAVSSNLENMLRNSETIYFGHAGKSINVLPTTFSCEQWPTHVREYACFPMILISSTDKIKPELRHALDDYVRLGGILAIIVPETAPWPMDDIPETPKCHLRRLGLGKIITCRPWKQENKAFVENITQKIEEANYNDKQSIIKKEDVSHKLPALMGLMKEMSESLSIRNNQPVIPDTLLHLKVTELPMFLLLCVMIIFAVIIGPLNYWYLQKKGKQLLLILTTPAISILFCLIVFLFITFREGWQSHGSVYGFTLLDQTEHQATTFARVVMNAALRPSGGFRFSADELISFNQEEGNIDVLDEPGQIIAPSIMKTRVPLDYNIKITEPRREQLEITFHEGMATVVNGLGAEILSLTVHAPDGNIYILNSNLPPGGSATLSQKDFVPIEKRPASFTFEQMTEFLNKQKNLLPPAGYYWATLKEPLFYSKGMEPDTLDATHYVIGRF